MCKCANVQIYRCADLRVLIARLTGAAACYFIYMTAHFSSPHENVLQLGLREGMKVGDFGAGSGHYSRAAAAIVGHGGKVYAIDVQDDVLKHLKVNTHDHHKSTIDAIWGDLEKLGGTHLRDASLDAGILANTLFQIENRDGLLAELKRVLKSGARFMLVDWAGSYGGMGPLSEQVVSEHEAEAFFINGGFHKVKSFRAGPHHYGVIFTAP
jgi:ubiquinone/menaquinone biosynthesis C-methylase UbiE